MGSVPNHWWFYFETAACYIKLLVNSGFIPKTSKLELIYYFKGVTLQKVKMAAIIAQMTRANRERKKNKCFEIVIGKCMYEIGPFPEKYEPEVNKFHDIS